LSDLEARLRIESNPEGVDFDPHPALIGSMSTLNMTTRCGDLNLTFTPAGLDGYDAVLANSVTFELDGQLVRVDSLDDIIGSKTAAGWAKDHETLPILHALREEIGRQET
jgi:hypothetical protein